MERSAKIKMHQRILAGLVSGFGVALFTLIGVLMASEIIENQKSVLPETSWYEYQKDFETIVLTDFKSQYEKINENYEHTIGTIYLTFDDGPGEYTEHLLDILKEKNVKATFFVTGRGEDAVILREHQEGHTVALHTWSHDYSAVYNSVESYFNDLDLVAERVKRITGEDAKIIRFPGGSSNLVSARYDGPLKIMSVLTSEVLKRGYVYFDWNVDSDDAGRADSADTVYNNVVTRLREGPNVVLQHDIKGFSVEAVRRIIDYGLNNGFDFQALEVDSPAIRHGVNN